MTGPHPNKKQCFLICPLLGGSVAGHQKFCALWVLWPRECAFTALGQGALQFRA